MEKIVRLPTEICDRIFASEFEIDTGTLSQELLTDAVELYGVTRNILRRLSASMQPKQQYKTAKTASMRLSMHAESSTIRKKSNDF